jgi:2-dehydro-3-deoxyglucarate aldolase/4-hydroxy-2-oxoheptanedioate aldolase
MHSLIKQRLADNQIVRVFGAGRMLHPVLLEILALHGGYDALWLDQEHCGLTTREIEHAALSARCHGLDSFVRMAPTDYATVTRAFEAGAGGVMAARVYNEQQAEQFVQWAKFHPRGNRGMNNGGYDGQYSRLPLAEFAEQANLDTFIAIQIETAEAVEDAAAIAAIDGVDLLFVGPSDLSQALGVTGQVNHPKCLEAIAHVAAVCKNHGKHWGVIAINPEYTEQRVAEGCRMLVIGGDVKVAHAGIEATKRAFAKYFD